MAKSPTKPANTPAAGDKTQDFESLIPDAFLPHLAALVLASGPAEGFLLMPMDDANILLSTDPALAVAWQDENNEPQEFDGNFKLRATDDGVKYSAEHPAEPSNTYEAGGDNKPVPANKSGFVRPTNIVIDDDGPDMPTAGRRGRIAEGSTAYPFDKLEVGKSFHIPATKECPDPAKSVASSVSAANDRYSDEDPEFDAAKYEGEGAAEAIANVEDDDHARKARVKEFANAADKTGKWVMRVVAARIYKRHFFTQTVGKDDKHGPGVRVWRDK